MPGFQEILVILVIAMLVVGPNRLPTVARDVSRFLIRARGEMRTLLGDLKGDMDATGMGDDLRELKRELDETRRMASQALRGEPETKPRPKRTPREDAAGDDTPANQAHEIDTAASGDSESTGAASSDTATGETSTAGAPGDGVPVAGTPVNGAAHGPALGDDASTHASTPAGSNGTSQGDPLTNGSAPEGRPLAGTPGAEPEDTAPDATPPPRGQP